MVPLVAIAITRSTISAGMFGPNTDNRHSISFKTYDSTSVSSDEKLPFRWLSIRSPKVFQRYPAMRKLVPLLPPDVKELPYSNHLPQPSLLPHRGLWNTSGPVTKCFTHSIPDET
ncbi:Hypothetical predicted protein [Pelobates cultripes]|uniref:Uncharacterized protein n=1 Tax=Pelobates cultripes TaxID=61616 RepID=A0AAD1RLK7_PELCU|nr:Hypothetical predicted protein [Pelobates cultripes]